MTNRATSIMPCRVYLHIGYTQKYELSNGLRGRSIMAFGSGGSCGPSKGPLRRAT